MSQSQALLGTFINQRFGFLTWHENIRPTANPNRFNTYGRYWFDQIGVELEGLEADFYCPQLRLVIEFDGVQHHRPNEHFHGGRRPATWWQRLFNIHPSPDRQKMIDGHLKQIDNDTRKVNLLQAQGVGLIKVDHHHREEQGIESVMSQVAGRGLQILPRIWTVTTPIEYEQKAWRDQLERTLRQPTRFSDADLALWKRLLTPRKVKRSTDKKEIPKKYRTTGGR